MKYDHLEDSNLANGQSHEIGHIRCKINGMGEPNLPFDQKFNVHKNQIMLIGITYVFYSNNNDGYHEDKKTTGPLS